MDPSGVITPVNLPVGDPRAGQTDGVLSRMGVRIGSLHLLLPADGAREVVPPPPVSRVPNTAPWLLGLANVRGSLVPVLDPAAAFGVARQTGELPYLLISGRGEATAGLLIDGLPRLFNISAAQRLVARPVAPSLLEEHIVAAYEHDDHIWIDLNFEQLLDAFARQVAL